MKRDHEHSEGRRKSMVDVQRASFKDKGSFSKLVDRERELHEKRTLARGENKHGGVEKKEPSQEGTLHQDTGSPSERLIAQAIKGEYSYSKLGLVLGVLAIIGGVIL